MENLSGKRPLSFVRYSLKCDNDLRSVYFIAINELYLLHRNCSHGAILTMTLRSIHAWNLLGVNYSLSNGSYCMKWVHSHLLFEQLLHVLKRSRIIVPIIYDCSSRNISQNSSRLINHRCKWTLNPKQPNTSKS